MALAINVTAKTLLPLYRACTHRIDSQSQSSDPQAKANNENHHVVRYWLTL
jgi:hypothetical protein